METKNQTGQESAQPGSTADYALSDYAGCGELLKKPCDMQGPNGQR